MIRVSTVTWTTVLVVVLITASFLFAAATLVTALEKDDRQRKALIRFMCATTLIEQRAGDLEADEYRRVFDLILVDLGEEPCPEKEE